MKDTLTEAVKAAPPVSLSGLSMWGVPIPEVLTILTIIYTLIMLINALPTLIKRVKQFVAWVKGVINGKSDRE